MGICSQIFKKKGDHTFYYTAKTGNFRHEIQYFDTLLHHSSMSI